ncbi:MAG: peptidylprolyl isomerase [Elusimicrobiota bacterium]
MLKGLLGILLVLGFCGGLAVSAENVLVTVDGEQITKDDLYIAMIQSYPQQANETLNRLANEILISKEAERKNVKVSADELKKRAEELGVTGELSLVVKRMIESSILVEKMITSDQVGSPAAKKKINVTNDEIKKFFEEKKLVLGESEQVHIKQIFVLAESEANEILLALKANADFSKMASVKSQDTASKEKGGDLGFFAKGTLQPDIEKVVFDMQEGETSNVIKTSAGFHIVKVEEKKKAIEAKFDSEMKKRVKKILLNSKIQAELPAWLDGLKTKAGIK